MSWFCCKVNKKLNTKDTKHTKFIIFLVSFVSFVNKNAYLCRKMPIFAAE